MSVVYWVLKFVTPSGSVQLSASDSITSGSRNWFQLDTMASTATVTRAGRDSGSRIRTEEAERAAAVDRGGVLELLRDAPEERPQDDDRQGQPERRLRQGQPERVVEQPEVADEDEQRQDRDRRREEQAEREHRVRDLAAGELAAGEDEGRQCREQRRRRPSTGRRRRRCCGAGPRSWPTVSESV